MTMNKFKRPSWIPRWVNLPFFLFLGFITLLLFFGDNNYMMIKDLYGQQSALNARIKAQQDSTAYFNAKLNALNTDRESLERLAREQYGMKRVNEEVFHTDIP